ncbi:Cell wall-associated hydrolase, NlpC family [Ruegeria halocynthiae]|uniref:Cell wall-associated hydrolase, NlpC family n=1 Tax=Ruegeria halocynthiae TaxID=985054 RepID=A0A1H3B5T4_9RHOB|nr:NlpC/P60 family protein [Ruegeria halocynthiae]SDX37297.1 Cell wall-associated hydrolase, NlpC family [Ruegeria halocynthiae]
MTQARIIHPVINLLRQPDGPRDRQLLFGDIVTVTEEQVDWRKITARKDGYQGWVAAKHLGPIEPQTHWIVAASTHAYEQPDMKSRDQTSLSFGSKVRALSEQDGFLQTTLGFIPAVHAVPAYSRLTDPVAAAELFLGTPYLWGGNSRFGLDCSGLVQAALLACGIPCPGDSSDQEREVGQLLPTGEAEQRGDLLCWKGHVAWVAAKNLLLHANAYHMAVALEPMDQAIARIAAQGDGPVTAHKRL